LILGSANDGRARAFEAGRSPRLKASRSRFLVSFLRFNWVKEDLLSVSEQEVGGGETAVVSGFHLPLP